MTEPRSLVYHIACTVDGCIADSSGGVAFFPTEGDHIPEYIASLSSYGAVIMGRKTYDMGLQHGVTDPYPFLDTYVVSKTLRESPDPKVKVWNGGLVERMRELKRQPGKPIYLCGGAQLAGEFFAHGLVDRLILKVNPVLLGGGIPLVTQLPRHVVLKLADEKRYQSGVMLLTYDVCR